MTDTVRAHVDAGTIAPRRRTTADALLFAAEWCDAYEGDPDEDRDLLTDLATVADFLRRQAARRKS